MFNQKSIKIFIAIFIFVIVFLSVYVMSFDYSQREVINNKIDNSIINHLQDGEKVRVIVEFNTSLPQQNINSKKDSFLSAVSGFNLRQDLDNSYWVSGELDATGLDNLINNKDVVRVIEEKEGTLALSESVSQIGVGPYVWNLGYSGKGQTICVIDSGINASHPDLSGKVLAEKCYCSITDLGFGGCCPNGESEDSSAEDDNGHGTHVSGIIVSQDSTYTGVAPNASIVVVKVTNSSGNWLDGDFWGAVKWCKDNKETYNISIITISLQTLPPYLYDNSASCEADFLGDEQINSANSAGIFVDVCSGNYYNVSNIAYPSCVSGATSVGATYKSSDVLVSFTNRGILLDLLAPGYNIYSLDYEDSGVTSKSGTSMAAPHVAGAAALLLEKNPSLTPAQIKSILQTTGVNISDDYDPSSGLSYSRINVSAAINSLDKSLDLDVIYPTTNINANQNQFFNVTVNVTCRGGDCGNVNVYLDPKETTYTST